MNRFLKYHCCACNVAFVYHNIRKSCDFMNMISLVPFWLSLNFHVVVYFAKDMVLQDVLDIDHFIHSIHDCME